MNTAAKLETRVESKRINMERSFQEDGAICFEGGGKIDKSTKEAGEKMKSMFTNDIMGKDHL